MIATNPAAVVPAQAGTHNHQGFCHRWLCHIALLWRMGPRLRGDDSGESLPQIFLRWNERSGSDRSRALALVASPSPRHRAIGPDAQIIIAHRGLRGSIASIEIALDRLERTLVRRPIAAATPGLDANEIARR